MVVKRQSRLLQSFRALGLITSDLPLVYTPMGKENFFTVSLGKAFQVYRADKLTPAIVSPLLTKRISAIEAKFGTTYTACGNEIIVWDRIVQRGVLTGHTKEITQLMCLGTLLLSISEDGTLKVWNTETMELVKDITLPEGFVPTFMMHPPTYLNKIVVASNDGRMALINIRTCKCVYMFPGWGAPITVIESSPALDVVAVGLANGRIILHHLKFDQTLMTFKQEGGRIMSLSFRTDSAKFPFLISGCDKGNVATWNLGTKKLESMMESAHEGQMVSIVCLPHEPLFVTTGTDNAIRMWIFDNPDGTARLLKSREGHQAPPTRIRYYGGNTVATMADGADGMSCQILSAGQDRAFRVFHTAREQQSREMSQGPLLKKAKKLSVNVQQLKLTPISQFASVETRAKDWANVVTCHENDADVYVWAFDKRAIGKAVLRQHDPSKAAPPGSAEARLRAHGKATSVTISLCGNFAVVGTMGGAIFKYNMQSGDKRGSFPTAATPQHALIRSLTLKGMNSTVKEDLTAGDAHTSAVCGLVVNALNQVLISGSLDGTLKYWDFKTHQILETVMVGSSISQIELHRDANLMVVVCDDQVLRVYDICTRKLVRRFTGHTHRITDVGFSPDARWLLSSSNDNSLRIWDLPTGRCVDWLTFPKAITGLALSPTGEFIATTHVGSLGIYMWANKAYFSTVFLDTEPKEPTEMGLPVPLAEVETLQKSTTFMEPSEDQVVFENEKVLEDAERPVGGSNTATIVFSTTPRAYWATLFHLELIKKRNKPMEPPKAPEQAPFFLPTIRTDDVNPGFVHKGEENNTMVHNALAALPSAGEWKDEDDDENDEQEEDMFKTRVLKSTGSPIGFSRCELAVLLKEVSTSPQLEITSSSVSAAALVSPYRKVSDFLQSLTASTVDVELTSLCLGDFDEEGFEYLDYFLSYATEEIASKRNFQVVQAYVNRFLKVHAELIGKSPLLLSKIAPLHTVQKEAWLHLQELLHQNLCLVQYFSKIQM